MALADTGTAIVLVSSTRIAAGERTDKTGPVIADWLRDRGFAVGEPRVVADADFAAALAAALAETPAVLISTGGTGPTNDDRVPEATAARLTMPMPGIAEAIMVERDGLKGLPESYIEGLKQEVYEGRTLYRVSLDYPEMYPFLDNAESEPLHKRALAIFEKAYPGDSYLVATSLNIRAFIDSSMPFSIGNSCSREEINASHFSASPLAVRKS